MVNCEGLIRPAKMIGGVPVSGIRAWIQRTLSSHYQLPMQLAAKTSNFIQRAWGADENSDGDDSSVDGYVLMVCFCFKFTPSGYIGLQIR